MQVGAVDLEVLGAEALAQQLAELAHRKRLASEAIADRAGGRQHGQACDGRPDAERVQHVCAIRGDRQPRAHFAELAGAFEDTHAVAGTQQAERGGQAADAAAGDEDA